MLVALPTVNANGAADRDFSEFVQFGSEEELGHELESVSNMLDSQKLANVRSPLVALLESRREILASTLGFAH